MPILPMPGKPADVGQLDVRSAGVPQSARGGDAYGAQAFREEAVAFNQLQGLGGSAVDYANKKQGIKDKFDLAVANTHSFQKDYNDNVIQQTDPSGAQLMPTTEEKFNEFMNDDLAALAKSGASKTTQDARRLQLLEEKRQFLDNAAVASTKMAEVNADKLIDEGTRTILNDIGVHGAVDQKSWEIAVGKGEKLIQDTPGGTQNSKDLKKKDLRNKAAILRFETLMYPKAGGNTKEDIEKINKELDDPYWQKQLETSDIDNIRKALAASRSAFAQLSVEGQQSPHVNRVAGHPQEYEAELANLLGVDKSGLDGITDFKMNRNVVSDMTRARFEAFGEQAVITADQLMESGKASTRDEAEAKIIALQKDLVDNPVWGQRLTPDQFRSLQDSLQTRKNALDHDWNELKRANATELEKQTNLEKADSVATAENFLTRQEKGRIPPGEFDAWSLGVTKVGLKNFTASQQYRIRKAYDMQMTLDELGDHPTPAQLDAAKLKVDRGGTGTGTKYSPTPSGGGAWKAGLQSFTKSRFGPAAINNMRPELGQPLYELIQSAPPEIQKEIEIYSGWRDPGDPTMAARHRVNPHMVANPLTSFHGKGLAADVHGSARAMAWLHAHAGEHGLDFPLTGKNGLPNEPWHIEPASNRAGGRSRLGGGGAGTPGGIDAWKAASAANETGTRASPYTVQSDRRASDGTYDWGKYQVNEKNIGPWTKQYYGTELSVKEFLANPDAQEKVYEGEFGRLVKKYGVRGAAAAWNGGEGGMNSSTAQAYADRFMRNLGAGGGSDTGGGVAGTGGGRPDLLSVPRTEEQANALEAIANAQKVVSDGLKNNTIEYGATALHLAVVGLDAANPETFDKRQQLYGKIDQYYGGLTTEQQHPLTQADVNVLSGQLNSNDSDKINQVWAAMAHFSPDVQEAAWKQMGETAPFGAAAGRVYASDRKAIANLAVRGHQGIVAMEDNGVTPDWLQKSKDWWGGMGDVLRGIMDPTKGVGMKQVVDAVHFARHKNEPFDAADYQKDYEDVMGVHQDVVNGGTADLIPGTTGKEWELALPVLDLTAVSLTQTPALAEDINGALKPVSPVAKENLIPIHYTDTQYYFADTDGNLLHTITNEKTAQYPDGKPQVYVAQLSAEIIHDAAAKAVAASAAAAMAPATRAPMGYDPSAGPPARVRAGPKGPEPVVAAPAAPPAPTSVPSLTSGVPGEAPGVPSSNVVQPSAGPKVITPEQEKSIQSNADDFIDLLSRNAGVTKEYLKTAREHYVETTRDYLLGRASK